MKSAFISFLFIPAVCILLISSCDFIKTSPDNVKKYVVSTTIQHPDWTENAVIYEVNLRQYTPEGTIEAFMEHLPRLEALGVDIVWLMPVFPIGELHRKASQTKLIEEIRDETERAKIMGSYYSIKDYTAINPDLGTLDDFKELVEEIHAMNMYVILDIAVNHTAWDHKWVNEHPDYYTSIDRDSVPWNPRWMDEHPEYYRNISSLGMTYPIDPNETDWWDAADLNFNNLELRKELIEIFKYWVSEFDIDGYRCDVAGMIPCNFWDEVRAELEEIKPVFMLAENENDYCLMKKAFDMNYSWEIHHLMNDIAKGTKTVKDLQDHFNREDSIFDPSIYRMNFITNHDENTWNGSEFERLGDATEVFAMLTFTIPGMPLIYSGQETGMTKRLRFFEKDTIRWVDNGWAGKYKSFIDLKTEQPVLWNGDQGGSFNIINIKKAPNVFAFVRENDDETLIVLANLSNEKVEFKLDKKFKESDYIDAFTQDEIDIDKTIKLKGFQYLVLAEDF